MATAEDIYQAYPRHVGRRAALTEIGYAIHRIDKRTDWWSTPLGNDPAEWLLTQTLAYATARRSLGPIDNLTPMPRTWFRQGRYDDDPAEWVKVFDKKTVVSDLAKRRRIARQKGFG